MKIDWRVSAISAGSAFFLSALIGVVGNVSLGMLILRAGIAATVFGAGAVGVSIVIDRYLPELRRASPASVASENGNTVDIVVEGDDGLETVERGPDETDAQSVVIDSGAVDEADGLSAGALDGELEEVVESNGTGGGTATAMDDEVEETEEIEEIEEIASVDDLPSVDSMADSFTEIPVGEDSAVDSSESGEDPALMARAIRTVLKREE